MFQPPTASADPKQSKMSGESQDSKMSKMSQMSRVLPAKTSDQLAKELSQQEYYHGLLPREDMISLLRRNGEFLIRFSEARKGEKYFILSTMYKDVLEKDGIKHFIINKTKMGKFVIETFGFTSIPEMIDFHLKGTAITKDGAVRIKTPIKRQPWEHAHEMITIGKKLGEGAFGEVSLGKLRVRVGPTPNHLLSIPKQPSKAPQLPVMPQPLGHPRPTPPAKKASFNGGQPEFAEYPVAIKLAKLENLTKEQIKEIMAEARLMRRFDHPNVVKFYGVATLQEPLMVLMELCSDGALDSYIRKNQPPLEKLHEMVMQAARGLEFIHRNNVIHRDIAARNCLYGGGQVKIADFGLSREGTSYQMDAHARVPIRWLAPEVLTTAFFTQKTDVWAFGIMSWEIYHGGAEPYPEMSVVDVATRLRVEGYRMPFREIDRPEVVRYIRVSIWHEDANVRPSMSAVVQELGRLYGVLPVGRPLTSR